MKLVIAEKPSVAQSLAAVIGATARKDGYLEGGGWRVSWCAVSYTHLDVYKRQMYPYPRILRKSKPRSRST